MTRIFPTEGTTCARSPRRQQCMEELTLVCLEHTQQGRRERGKLREQEAMGEQDAMGRDLNTSCQSDGHRRMGATASVRRTDFSRRE